MGFCFLARQKVYSTYTFRYIKLSQKIIILKITNLITM